MRCDEVSDYRRLHTRKVVFALTDPTSLPNVRRADRPRLKLAEFTSELNLYAYGSIYIRYKYLTLSALAKARLFLIKVNDTKILPNNIILI